jgi:UDP:flavonoid glycosyltransferase YjiC (YdhE family)
VRFHLTFVGGTGHLDPLLPVARALEAAGHEVAIAGSGNQMRRVEEEGFTALATSPQGPRAQQERDRAPLEPVVAHDTEVEFAENFADKGARRHVVAVGEHLAAWRPAELGPQPDHVRVEQYVAQGGVLPGCALVVSHGGSGSLMGALEHGLPSVLLPLGADQPHNARRAADLGVATVLDAATATPAEVGAAVAAALADRASYGRARVLKAEIDALPPVAATVARLEQLAGH